MSERDWKDRLHDSGHFPWKYYREAGNGTVEAMVLICVALVIVVVVYSTFSNHFPYWFNHLWGFVALGFGWLSGIFAAQRVRNRHWDEAINWYIKKYVD